eukprot:m.22526 g.22526  ORF g.22526 m.22526 type:complete len:52 (-) comp10759_c0_seq2:1412-1567(-)
MWLPIDKSKPCTELYGYELVVGEDLPISITPDYAGARLQESPPRALICRLH